MTTYKKLRLKVLTPHGEFLGKKAIYNEDTYKEITSFMEKLGKLEYFSFETETENEVYMTEKMIGNSVFIVERLKA